jgi:hypothetical protein
MAGHHVRLDEGSEEAQQHGAEGDLTQTQGGRWSLVSDELPTDSRDFRSGEILT